MCRMLHCQLVCPVSPFYSDCPFYPWLHLRLSKRSPYLLSFFVQNNTFVSTNVSSASRSCIVSQRARCLLISFTDLLGRELSSLLYLSLTGQDIMSTLFEVPVRTSPRTPCRHLIPDNLENNIRSCFCYVMAIAVFIYPLSSQPPHFYSSILYS